MLRWLVPLSLLLAGCQTAHVLPVDVVVRPRLEAKLELPEETVPLAASFDWTTGLIVAGGLVLVALVLKRTRPTK